MTRRLKRPQWPAEARRARAAAAVQRRISPLGEMTEWGERAGEAFYIGFVEEALRRVLQLQRALRDARDAAERAHLEQIFTTERDRLIAMLPAAVNR